MKPSTEAVLDLIRRLDGACPQDFTEQIHTARYSARVMELCNAGLPSRKTEEASA